MIVGDSTIGNATIGVASTPVNLSLSSTSTNNLTINKTIELSLTATSDSDSTVNKKINLSFQAKGPQVGDFAIGDSVIGATLGEPTATQAEATFNSTKGITQTLSAASTSSLTIFRKVNLALSAAASVTPNFAVFKGVNVQFQSTPQGTVVFLPDYDEIIGRTRADGEIDNVERADGERVFILQAEGNID